MTGGIGPQPLTEPPDAWVAHRMEPALKVVLAAMGVGMFAAPISIALAQTVNPNIH